MQSLRSMVMTTSQSMSHNRSRMASFIAPRRHGMDHGELQLFVTLKGDEAGSPDVPGELLDGVRVSKEMPSHRAAVALQSTLDATFDVQKGYVAHCSDDGHVCV
jgi:hypothetical protein